MVKRFKSPPNWPAPPPGWTPPEGWTPDPSWGPVPDGWDLYVEDTEARPWWRARWVLPVAAGVLGLFIGVGIGGGEPEPAPAAEPSPTVTVTSEPSPAVTRTVDPTAEQLAALVVREVAVATKEGEVAAREAAVAASEVRVAEGTIPGNGMFLVGAQVQPGRYQSPGGTGCYWARLDEAGEIIDNNLGDGPSLVTVQSGDSALEVSRCQPFVKVG